MDNAGAVPRDLDLMKLLADAPKLGNGMGFHRMAWFLDTLEAPDWLSVLDAVKVTGSKGKGSVCAMLAAVFSQLGIAHGLHTSPHLRHSRERIVIDGEPVSDEELAAAWRFTERRLTEWAERHPDDPFTKFESLTAVALACFSRRALPTVISEAGIGGRFCATRFLPGRVVALTSLELEHTDRLGERLELIAYNKADLCPDGGTLVVGSGVDADVLRRLRGYAQVRGIRLTAVDDVCRLVDCRFEGSAMSIDVELRGRRLEGVELAMAGRHQWSNAVVAFLLAEAWTRRHRPQLGEESLIEVWRRGLTRARLTGRFEKVASDPDVYVDICHTPGSAAALVGLVREALAGHRILLVLGVPARKQVVAVAEALLDLADAVVCTRAWDGGSPVEAIDELVSRARPDLPRWCVETIDEAVAFACREAERRDMTVVVAGGVHIGVEAMEVLAGRDPRQLRFF